MIRRGAPADAAAVIGLFDEAVEWLVARGQTGQWGTEPLSRNAGMVARVEGWAGAPTLVAFYERQGFARDGTFDVNGWQGQVFSMRL
jgi:hypothetical protein